MKLPTAKLAPWGVPVLLGIPLDHNSSFLRGPAEAPALIREALHSHAWNQWAENRIDLGREGWFEDAGDLQDMEAPDAFRRYIQALPAPMVGADVVEFNPVRDRSGLTATMAAKILKELLGKMLAP